MVDRRIPSYRRHKHSGQAVVTLDGRDFYLGPWRSKVSRTEYDRLIGEWLANGRRLPSSLNQTDITITELVELYWDFAKSYYVKNGHTTGHLPGVRVALRILRQRYGATFARDFGPLALRALQQQMIELGQSRRYINDNVARMKRLFKWAASRELAPVQVHQALATVPGLIKGRTDAREAEPITPVSDADFQAALPELPGVVAAMAQFQRLTGCRPGEVCLLRPCDVDRSSDVLCYRPESHKTQHRDRRRQIYVGPRARKILEPWLNRPPQQYCFSPKESARQEQEAVISLRTALGVAQYPRWNRRGDHYTKDSYRRAIVRACNRAGIAPWSPNRLRHSRATELRHRFGLEAAQTVLGHASADVTQVYAERDFKLAKQIMQQVG